MNKEKEKRPKLSDEEYRKRKQERNKALRKSFEEDHPQLRATGGGADLDAEIAALDQRVTALETKTTNLDQRVTALESGEQPEPPEPPEPEPGDKRYPDANDPMCGVPQGTSLTSSGSTNISQDGAKVSGKKFTGRVTIDGDNVELFNCEIYTGDWWGLVINGRNAKVHHCYIHSDATNGNSGINLCGDGAAITYNKFRGWENCVNFAADDWTFEWNDCDMLKGNSDSHYDTIQADGGFGNGFIRHNRMICNHGQTSACMIDNYFGNIHDITCEDNFFDGGGYTVYLDGSFKGSGQNSNIKYLNNVMGRGYYGYIYWKSPGSGCEHRGNVDADTGAPCD